jgi:hypothetical protein
LKITITPRTAVLNNDPSDCRVIVAEQRHHVFCIRAFYESGEPAQVTEERGNLSTVAL